MPLSRTLVVGATGQVGHAIAQQLGAHALPAGRNPKDDTWLRLELAEAATADPATLDALIPSHNLDAIICSAGATDVERCESDHDWAAAANHLGPAALARAAARASIPFVFFSTDYVFDGTHAHPGPYRESDPTNPLSVYGRSKLDGERAVLDAHPRALVLRTTTVYGPDPQGKNFLYTLRRLLSAGTPMRVPTDQLATPTYNQDLAAATLELLRNGHTGLFHAAGPDFLSRLEFALLACDLLHLPTATLHGVSTAELNQRAARPLLGGLNCDHLRSTLGRELFRSPRQGILDWQTATTT